MLGILSGTILPYRPYSYTRIQKLGQNVWFIYIFKIYRYITCYRRWVQRSTYLSPLKRKEFYTSHARVIYTLNILCSVGTVDTSNHLYICKQYT